MTAFDATPKLSIDQQAKNVRIVDLSKHFKAPYHGHHHQKPGEPRIFFGHSPRLMPGPNPEPGYAAINARKTPKHGRVPILVVFFDNPESAKQQAFRWAAAAAGVVLGEESERSTESLNKWKAQLDNVPRAVTLSIPGPYPGRPPRK